jgi:hypothetical protein
MIIPNTLNTLGYPSQLTFSHSSSQYYTSLDSYQAPKLFINTVVDGEVIQWGFSQMQFSANFGSTSPGQLAAIPEPSTYAAILAGISLVITLAWKRFRRAQPQGVE